MLGGVAGVLYAPHQGLVTPNLAGFILSAELLIWTAVGGRKRLFGPVIGAILVGSLTAELRDVIPIWELMVAALFIFVVLFLPDGIAGWPERLFQRVFGRRFSGDEINLAVKIGQKSPELDWPVTVCPRYRRYPEPVEFSYCSTGDILLDRSQWCRKTSTFNATTGAVKIQAGSINSTMSRFLDFNPTTLRCGMDANSSSWYIA